MYKKYILGVVAVCLAVALFLSVSPVYAQVGDVNAGLDRVGGQIGASAGTGIFRPGDSVVIIIAKIIKILLFVAGAIAVLFVVIGGFMYLTSAGNEEGATKGKNTIVNALIGIIIIILSYVIVSVVINLVQSTSSSVLGT